MGDNALGMKKYFQLIRIDHWIKNLIIFLGSAFCFIILKISVDSKFEFAINLIFGFLIIGIIVMVS
jgi:4-hydroxybenzoate polyprenyltransferase